MNSSVRRPDSRRSSLAWLSAICLMLLALGLARPSMAQDAAEPADLDRIFRRSTLQIATVDARLHRFNIWIADDEPRRQRGLMFVKHLAAEDGMLFVYPQAQPISMWMKNTFVPLDMLFVEPHGKVTRVVKNTAPMSLKVIESGGPVLGVIELAAGTAERLNITAGAQVTHEAFAKK